MSCEKRPSGDDKAVGMLGQKLLGAPHVLDSCKADELGWQDSGCDLFMQQKRVRDSFNNGQLDGTQQPCRKQISLHAKECQKLQVLTAIFPKTETSTPKYCSTMHEIKGIPCVKTVYSYGFLQYQTTPKGVITALSPDGREIWCLAQNGYNFGYLGMPNNHGATLCLCSRI